jgi:hypothetical protein
MENIQNNTATVTGSLTKVGKVSQSCISFIPSNIYGSTTYNYNIIHCIISVFKLNDDVTIFKFAAGLVIPITLYETPKRFEILSNNL